MGVRLTADEIEEFLSNGHELIFTTLKMTGTSEKIYVSYPNLAKDVKVGERIFLDDGKMEVMVKEILNEQEIKISVTLGGILLPKKGVNLPDSALNQPAVFRTVNQALSVAPLTRFDLVRAAAELREIETEIATDLAADNPLFVIR